MRMKLFSAAVLLALAVSGFAHGPAPLKSPAVDCVREGDFAKAMTLFAEEVKASDDVRLKRAYSQLKITLRREKSFAGEKDPAAAARLGRQLRAFYYQNGLFAKAEAVDKRVYELAPTSANAVSYGITLLNLDKNREAADLFSKVDLKGAKPGAVLCVALAYARTGDKAKSEELCKPYPVEKMSASDLKLYSRIAALNNDIPACASAVRRILEQAPFKEHHALKHQLFSGADFRNAAASPLFKEALNTQSKVKDKCATCPNRGTDKCDDRD